MLPRFTNRNYPYATPDDTFIARGLHLNMLRDELLSTAGTSNTIDVSSSSTISTTLGLLSKITAVFIDYKGIYTITSALDTNGSQAGHLEVSVSYNETYGTSVNFTRTATNHSSGSAEDTIVIDFIKDGDNLVMTVEETEGLDLTFMYHIKIFTDESN